MSLAHRSEGLDGIFFGYPAEDFMLESEWLDVYMRTLPKIEQDFRDSEDCRLDLSYECCREIVDEAKAKIARLRRWTP